MNICVFLGSSIGKNSIYAKTAFELGKQIAIANHKLVYGGGGLGLMNELANGCLSAGGDVYGVITERLLDMEAGHEGIQELKIVQTMHERKIEMYNNADAFLIFPGGIGTLEEFFEIYSWKQLRLHKKPIFIYNFNDFWRDLFTLLENIIKKDFAGENMKEAYKVINNYSDLTKELEINVEN